MVRIGVPLRYNHLNDGRLVLYLGEIVRRTFQKAGAFLIPIVQVQDFDFREEHKEDCKPLNDKEKELVDKYLDTVDGVLLPGGIEVTSFDRYLVERCIDRDIPVLGICLGMQAMSGYAGEYKLEKYEDNNSIKHCQDDDNVLTHKVKIDKSSLLYKIIGKEEIMVNSFHNYHIVDKGKFDVSALAKDGTIEGIEMKDKKFVLGVQWHPEVSYEFDENSKLIIDAFINTCKKC
ncbi:MAG: gamma-glutamyl-gamma-aminobutyrate hydrolase family protein [Bacilli bacterium]|nr:gamma-glutamyl-gamma-aminobutyrate hydrolase family protein [Bacilli bacterium]